MSAAPLRVLVNGRDAREIDALDRALHYGDGLFETIVARGGRARFIDLHWQRLTVGCRRLAIPTDGLEDLRTAVLTAAADFGDCLIKVIVTRGSLRARGYGPRGDELPRQLLFVYPAADEPIAAARVWRCDFRIAAQPALAGLKTLNRLDQVLAQREWQTAATQHALALQEGIVRGVRSAWLSGTMTNLFIVRGDRLTTPDLSDSGIAGVMRAIVLREAPRLSLHAAIGEIDDRSLDEAEEVFLTNVRFGILPVMELHAAGAAPRRFAAPGAVTLRLRQTIAELFD
ncbi:MAG: aminodeoxychorismate lyase [Steroidobacteraceae bacterium]|nr:aminodeoxychorismate lyase [Steroidobacteraceae bacterium]MDW8259485.1 aminodeoxychorismate lyase [Gammaproteobacteria bacterium]